ncbi:MAG: helix-turn-helix domain-containing protein [Candidatus Eisenbacteria bacterium]|nr:helix-turn-helix domain-containing protein [Candidatus Eisenbacteria bacterium]
MTGGLRIIRGNQVPHDADSAPQACSCGSRESLANLPPLLAVPELARLLRTSRKAIYAMVERGQLPGAVRIGRRLLFDRDDLLDWLHRSRAPSPEGVSRR